jgi:hypothetical protein
MPNNRARRAPMFNRSTGGKARSGPLITFSPETRAMAKIGRPEGVTADSPANTRGKLHLWNDGAQDLARSVADPSACRLGAVVRHPLRRDPNTAGNCAER